MIAVLVPCFNEAMRFNTSEWVNFVKTRTNIDFFFIDDGSFDETLKLLNLAFKDIPNCKVISHHVNLGKGPAIRAMVNTLDVNTYTHFGFIDADLEIPLEQIDNLYAQMVLKPDAFVCYSYRNFTAKDLRNFYRFLGSFAIRKLSSILIKYKTVIEDTQCGCKLFSVNVIDVFKKPFISEWLFDIELILRVRNRYDPEGTLFTFSKLDKLNNVESKANFSIPIAIKLIKQLYTIHRCYN